MTPYSAIICKIMRATKDGSREKDVFVFRNHFKEESADATVTSLHKAGVFRCANKVKRLYYIKRKKEYILALQKRLLDEA